MRLSDLVSLLSAGFGSTAYPPLSRRRSRVPFVLRRSRREELKLASARYEFADALFDLRSPDALDLKSRIATTRSLPELWHYREQVFGLVACARSQSEAQVRVAELDRHFA